MLLACYTLYLSAVVSQAKEAQKEEELSGTLRKLEEDQFVKVKEKHKIDGKLEEDSDEDEGGDERTLFKDANSDAALAQSARSMYSF